MIVSRYAFSVLTYLDSGFWKQNISFSVPLSVVIVVYCVSHLGHSPLLLRKAHVCLCVCARARARVLVALLGPTVCMPDSSVHGIL